MDKQEFIKNLTNRARQILPESASLWLYGSRARGDEREDSDWDVLILLDKEKREASDLNYGSELQSWGFDYDQYVSPQTFTKKQWRDYLFTPFEKNVEQDKIVLI